MGKHKLVLNFGEGGGGGKREFYYFHTLLGGTFLEEEGGGDSSALTHCIKNPNSHYLLLMGYFCILKLRLQLSDLHNNRVVVGIQA